MIAFRSLSDWIGEAPYRRELLVLAAFLLLALVFTYPLGFVLGDSVVQPAEDPQLNSWIMAWDVHALLTEPENLFQGNTFYPYPYALAYSEHLLASAVIGMPLQLFFSNPIAAYGLLNLLTFVLSGYGAYLLGRRVSGSAWAGFMAGIIFAFCPYKLSQIHHFQNLSAQWMPFAFLFLNQAIERGRLRDMALLGLFILLQALSSVYYALFLAAGILIVVAPLLLMRYWKDWREMGKRLLQLTIVGIVTAGCALPFFLPYLQVVEVLGAGRSLSYVTQLSPDLTNYLAAAADNLIYGDLTASLRKEPEGSLLPGVIALALALIGVVAGWRNTRQDRRPQIVGFTLLVLGAGLLSLGPTIHVAGKALVRGPYLLLWRYVPGFSGVRVPGRFAVLVMLGLAVLASVGAAVILNRLRPTRQAAAALALVLLIGVEYVSFPLPIESVSVAGPVPAVYEWLAEQPDDFALLELPIDEYPAFEHDIQYIGQSTRHWKWLVNGYSGNFPAGYLALVRQLQSFPDQASIDILQRMGVRYVIVHRDMLYDESRAAFDATFFRNLASLIRVGTFDDTWVYQVELFDDERMTLDLGTLDTRPFLLKGWSHNDDQMGGRRFVWTEGAESTMLMPAWEETNRALTIVARVDGGTARCQMAFAGDDLGECLFSDDWTECRLQLPAPPSPAVHLLEWQCEAPRSEITGRQIGETGAVAPVDRAGTIAGRGAGDYADLYVAGKRYSVDPDCPTCVGFLALRAGRVDDVLCRQFDLSQSVGVDELLETVESLPARSVVMFAARGEAEQPAALRVALSEYGADDAMAIPDGEAYLLIGVQGAPAGTAIEAACRENCWEYLGARWPDRRLAVTSVEIGP